MIFSDEPTYYTGLTSIFYSILSVKTYLLCRAASLTAQFSVVVLPSTNQETRIHYVNRKYKIKTTETPSHGK